MTMLPEASAIKLGLVIDLDICVGCQAASSTARNGTPPDMVRRLPMMMPMARLRQGRG